MQAALVFEVLMYLNSYYFGLFTIWEFVTYLIKTVVKESDYHGNTTKVWIECVVFLLFCFFEAGRLYLGRKSDSCDKPIYIVFSLLLVIPTSGAVVYLLECQVFSVRLETMLCSFQLFLEVFELFFGLVHLVTYRADKY